MTIEDTAEEVTRLGGMGIPFRCDHTSFSHDLAKAAMNRLAFGMAQDLRPYDIASAAVSSRRMRTDLVLRAFTTDEAHRPEVPALAPTEAPRYVGRAVVAPAVNSGVTRKAGGVVRLSDLAREHGFRDVGGLVVPTFDVPGVEGWGSAGMS